MARPFRTLFLVWVFAYPILPIAPLIGALIAWFVGPPFVIGVNADGWPQIGRVTPLLVFVTIVVPWVTGAALIHVLAPRERGGHE